MYTIYSSGENLMLREKEKRYKHLTDSENNKNVHQNTGIGHFYISFSFNKIKPNSQEGPSSTQTKQ